ncbi:hypothetical protein, partial [Sporisorium scitamineum]
FVAGKVSAGVAAATAGLAGAIAAREGQQDTEGKANSHFPEIIDTGKGKINMYEAPVITTNIPTPVTTKMYSMNKIL